MMMRLGVVALALMPIVQSAMFLPEQIHLALGKTPDTMTVMWVTEPDDAHPTPPCSSVEYNIAGGKTVSRDGQVSTFKIPYSWEVTGDFVRGNISRELYVHKAQLVDLEPLQRYEYRVGCEMTGWSSLLSFTSQQNGAAKRWPVSLVWLGDMGEANGRSFPALQREADSGSVDAMIHLGDLAYDLDTRYDSGAKTGNTGLDGGKGDQFMRDLSPIASKVPYMVCPGNHESNFNFTAFTHRFNGMPSNAEPLPAAAGVNIAGMDNNWWYSFNVGNVHMVSLNAPATTLPTQYTAQSRYKWAYPTEVGQAQYDWLKQDLAAARANATSAPWIIVFSHYPMYCSHGPTSDCGEQARIMRHGIGQADPPVAGAPGWEPLLKEYGVDLYISAHVHNYERILPVYNGSSNPKWRSNPDRIVNPTDPIHVVSGSAGNVENQEVFEPPFAAGSVFRTMDYGYNRMLVHNETHLEWLYVTTTDQADQGNVTDRMWLIKGV